MYFNLTPNDITIITGEVARRGDLLTTEAGDDHKILAHYPSSGWCASLHYFCGKNLGIVYSRTRQNLLRGHDPHHPLGVSPRGPRGGYDLKGLCCPPGACIHLQKNPPAGVFEGAGLVGGRKARNPPRHSRLRQRTHTFSGCGFFFRGLVWTLSQASTPCKKC
jgi:hypothetical protein